MCWEPLLVPPVYRSEKKKFYENNFIFGYGEREPQKGPREPKKKNFPKNFGQKKRLVKKKNIDKISISLLLYLGSEKVQMLVYVDCCVPCYVFQKKATLITTNVPPSRGPPPSLYPSRRRWRWSLHQSLGVPRSCDCVSAPPRRGPAQARPLDTPVAANHTRAHLVALPPARLSPPTRRAAPHAQGPGVILPGAHDAEPSLAVLPAGGGEGEGACPDSAAACRPSTGGGGAPTVVRAHNAPLDHTCE